MQRNLINKIHAYILLQRLYAHLLFLKYISFTYNTDFRVSAETVNSANSVSFTYDNDGLLTGAGSLTLTRNTSNGLITGTTLGSVTTSQSYNNFGEMSQLTASYGGGSTFNVQYTRDALGRITQKVETAHGVPNTYAYSYDTAGRLTQVNLNGAMYAQYSYDSNSNRVGWCPVRMSVTHFQPLINPFQKDFFPSQRKLFSFSYPFPLFLLSSFPKSSPFPQIRRTSPDGSFSPSP